MKQKIYRIKNLSCANCAQKVEEYLTKQDEIHRAVINFTNSSLQIKYKDEELEIVELERRIHTMNSDNVKLEALDVHQMSMKQSIWTKESVNLLIRILISGILAIGGFIVFLALKQWNMADMHYPFWELGKLSGNTRELTLFWSEFAVMITAFLLVGYDIGWKVIKGFKKPSTMLNENFLMFMAALGAIAIGNFFEGALVLILAQVGQLFEKISVTKSRNAVIDAINLRPSNANLIVGNDIHVVEPSSLNVNDFIEIRVGETIPVDGVVVRGSGSLNTMSLTGESRPVHVGQDDAVMSGTTLIEGSLVLRVEHTFENSKIAKLIELVMNSGSNKGVMESFLQKFAKWYTPIVISLALLVFIIFPFAAGGWVDNWTQGLYIALTFLTVGCPCAILVAVPIAYFCGAGLASKNKIIIKGSNYLEGLLRISEVITDKTGTLTKGEFTVIEENVINGTKDDFINILLAMESRSNHPIAISLKTIYKDTVISAKVQDFQEIAGFGLKAIYNKNEVLVGGQKLLLKEGIEYPQPNEYGTEIYVVLNKKVIGYIVLGDMVKDDSTIFIKTLKDQGVKVTMLTGDGAKNAEHIGHSLGIDNVVSNLLPDEKVAYVEEAKKKNKYSTIYIGDGINDAACIISSDVGVAMGGIGSDVSVDNADIVIMNDQPSKLIDAQKIAKATRLRAIVNIVIALMIKVGLMIFALIIGKVNPSFPALLVAVLGDTGLTIVCIIYSSLLIRKKITPTHKDIHEDKCTKDHCHPH